MDAKTAARLAILTNSGFESISDVSDAFFAQIEQLGEDALKSKAVSLDQSNGIKRCLHNSPQTYEVLKDLISSLNGPIEQKDNLHFCLVMLMDDLFNMGSVVMLDEKNQQANLSILHREQAAIARAANAEQATSKNTQIKKAILEITKGDGLVDSDKYAGSIEEAVWRHLGVSGTKRGYKRRTIQRQVSSILEDCRKA